MIGLKHGIGTIVNNIDLTPLASRARLSDVAIRAANKYKECSSIAVEAYLESANRLAHSRKPHLLGPRLRRAGQLLWKIASPSDERWGNLNRAIERVIETYRHDENPWICEELMRIQLQFKLGDNLAQIRICEEIAKCAEASGNWGLANRFWRCQAEWHQVQGEKGSILAALKQAARTHVGEADAALRRNPPSHSACAANLKSAMEALRRLPGTEREVERIHIRILDEQRLSMGECSEFQVSVDLSNQVDQTVRRFTSLSLPQSLRLLGECSEAVPIEALRQSAERDLADAPFLHLFGAVHVSKDGKQIARTPGGKVDDSIEKAPMLRVLMHRQNASNRQIWVTKFVLPALHVIHTSHPPVQIRDLEFLVRDNPFVPPGREAIYLRGLFAGFERDYLISSHLLIPQIESSLRHLMVTYGGDRRTSSLSENGDQLELTLDSLLGLDVIQAILDPSLHFDLSGLLSCRGVGENLRHDFCHGFIDFEAFGSTSAVYLWWIVYHICARPDLLRLQPFGSSSTPNP